MENKINNNTSNLLKYKYKRQIRCLLAIFVMVVGILLVSPHTNAQTPIPYRPDDTIQIENKGEIKKDTFSFCYHFEKGDTLIYSVMSRDSIVIDYGKPLLRIRVERIMLTCDSVTPEGRYCLTQKLVEYKSKENHDQEKNITRTTTPWLNVPVYIEMDTMGRRLLGFIKLKEKFAALTPGGAFQPFLLMPLADDTTSNLQQTEQSWIYSTKLATVPENGFPYPTMRWTTLYRMKGIVDTLDCVNMLGITFSMTSAGTIAIRDEDEDVDVTTHSVNNAVGEYFFDTTYRVPKIYTHTMEQKLTITDSENKGGEIYGNHYIYTIFTLESINRKLKKN